MKRRVRAYLELIRLPNLPTAAADVMAGILFVGGSRRDAPDLALLVVASICLYAGGVALNDVCDARHDAAQRSDRPIPSGRVSHGAALCLSIVLLMTGMAAGLMSSTAAGIIAAGIALAIVLYDWILKTTAVAPAMMGVCRALNLMLGMSIAYGEYAPGDGTMDTPASLSTIALWMPPLVMWLYVTSLTVFARTEASASSTIRLKLGTMGVVAAVALPTSLLWILPNAHLAFLLIVAATIITLARTGARAIASAAPEDVQRATGAFVMGIVLLDVAFVAASRGPMLALTIAATLLPVMLLRRFFSVT